MNWDPDIVTTIAVAVLGLAGAQVVGLLSRRHDQQAALLSRQHDREQAARAVLIAPAKEFARAALAALAALRYVTPPSLTSPGDMPHRNSVLLGDARLREERFETSRHAIDSVRPMRADVRLAFHPKSWAAEHSRAVLAHLRDSLEIAEGFYAAYDRVRPSDADTWRASEGAPRRDAYHAARDCAYESLDAFFIDVATRLIRPTWDPSKIAPADRPPGAGPE